MRIGVTAVTVPRSARGAAAFFAAARGSGFSSIRLPAWPASAPDCGPQAASSTAVPSDGLNADHPPHETLSERKWQVFLRLAKGEMLSAVADAMTLPVKTVSTYRTRVLAKLKLAQ